MNEVLALLADNALLLVGLVMGLLMVGLKKLAAKTDNKIDDQVVAKIVENKEGLSKKLVALLLKKLKKDEPKDQK